ncbi:MAG TPA: esterase-like activity of phytase family protein [Planctomycetota bacterium]|nr:esterase-like activity of phytase family protein [Planctomycetota bacterium]
MSPPGVTLIGVASIAADANDRSKTDGELIPGTQLRQDRLGSMGSGIDYTGQGNTYLALCDRGPKDGAVAYVPRFQQLSIAVDAKEMRVSVRLEQTTLFSDEQGRGYSGLAASFDSAAPAQGRRLDTEGIRVAKDGNIFTSDEYGPWIDEWTARGVHVRRIELPAKFPIAKLGATPADEFPPNNASGRQSNRGMEGLARSPDGNFLYGVMQSPLIQDGGLDDENKRVGTNVRVLELELASGKTREFLYVLEGAKNGVNEIVAVGPHTFLVIERDGAEGTKAEFKRLYKVELDGASDISALEKLPVKDVPHAIVPVKKSLFLDFLDPRFGLAGEKMPEKIEGLAFGPKFADGRLLLIVSIDNDFRQDVPNTFWAFAVDATLLPEFERAAFTAR